MNSNKYPRLNIKEPTPSTDIDPNRLVEIGDVSGKTKSGDALIAIRTGAEFAGKAIYLDDEYDWQLGTDRHGTIVLVPLKRVD